jgi:hypothetical protein
MKKRIREISAMRFNAVVMGLCAIIAIGYILYVIFRFVKVASTEINDLKAKAPKEDEPGEDEPEDEDGDEPGETNIHANNGEQRQTQTAQ